MLFSDIPCDVSMACSEKDQTTTRLRTYLSTLVMAASGLVLRNVCLIFGSSISYEYD